MAMDYDSMAHAYARHCKAGDPVIDELREYGEVASSSRVLEIGCGTAAYLNALAGATVCRGWGVEPSTGMRARAAAGDRIQLLPGSAESLPFDDDCFDLVCRVQGRFPVVLRAVAAVAITITIRSDRGS